MWAFTIELIKPGKRFVDFRAAGRIVHLNAAAFGADEARITQGLEMLGQGRFGNIAVTHFQESGACLGTTRRGDADENGHPGRIGQGMQDTLDGYVFDRWMEKRPHWN